MLHGNALYCAKPTLRVSPYFQILALFKSFWRRVHPTLLKQELQTFECIKQHTLLTGKLIKSVKLSTWWLPQTSGTHIWESRRFESMYTLQGKTWPTRHTYPMLGPHMVLDHTYLTWSTHSNLSCSRPQSWAGPLLLRKRAHDTIHNMSADWSTGPYPVSLPSQPMKKWGQSQHSIDGRLLDLPVSYHRHVIGTFNTCSRGPTQRFLTDTGGGYSLKYASFQHTTPRPSKPTILPFSPKGSVRSLC
jgi:hypothetical protein